MKRTAGKTSNRAAGGTIRIRAFADLCRFVPAESEYEINRPTPISEILVQLSVPPEKKMILTVNHRHADPADLVEPGDRLALFPLLGGG